jgi:CBS domain-containing protein
LPVLEIATVAPMTIDVNRPAFEALLLMARHNIHHVPVLDGQRVAGMVTATDLTEQHSTSAVYLAGEIHKQSTVEGWCCRRRQGQGLAAQPGAAAASAYSTGHIITADHRRHHRAAAARWPRRSWARHRSTTPGWPPGSQARSEQTAKSDQDNCLVLDDRYDPVPHGDLLQALAELRQRRAGCLRLRVLPGRDDGPHRRMAAAAAALGRVLPPLDRRARTQGADADLRVLRPAPGAGSAALLDDLRRDVLRKHARQPHLPGLHGRQCADCTGRRCRCSAASRPCAHGEVRDAVDLKHSGIVPIVDLARIYALAGGHEAVNTHER